MNSFKFVLIRRFKIQKTHSNQFALIRKSAKLVPLNLKNKFV